jgi:hypothetical protein
MGSDPFNSLSFSFPKYISWLSQRRWPWFVCYNFGGIQSGIPRSFNCFS